MRKINLLFMLLAIIGFPPMMAAQSSSGYETFTMPKKDGQQGDRIVGSPLLFYDMGGPSGQTVGYYAGYTRFVPAVDGEQITITFNMLDLGGNASLYIYDGDISFKSYSAEIPAGYLAQINGTEAGQSYTSTSGSLSVLYHCKGSGSGAGWEALVESGIPKSQEWQSISVSQDDLPVAYAGKKDMPLICVNASTEGSLDPLALTSLSFALDGTLDLTGLSNLRVIYSKGRKVCDGVMVGQAVDKGSSALQFSFDQTLGNGNNYFWLVADISDSAPVGSTVDAALTSAVVSGEEKVASAVAPEGSVELKSIYNMQPGQSTIEIGNLDLQFYDDGGVDGNISEQFSGQVTFLPTSDGKKVEIQFTMLDLFNTSTTGLNDELKVYSGREATDANLIASVLKDPVTLHSTSPDGALTVKLVSKTGVPKPGFEAMVREFTPQAMSVQSLVASHPSADPVSAGTKGVEMLLIEIDTDGTEPPKSLTAMNFSASGSLPLDKATLYSLGTEKTGSRSLIGSVDNPAATFTINLTEAKVLKEHANYFLLSYDIGDLAAQDSEFDLSLVSAAFGSDLVTASSGNPDGNRKIDNVYYSATGSFNKLISGKWKFRNSPSEYSYYGYDNTEGNQIVTFTPANPGTVIELDFSKFAISYPSYSSGSDPVFVVYDGADTSAPEIWRMAKADKDNGPGHVLRASNPEGKLTVLFNSNGQRGASGAGWEADLCEYVSKPMTVESLTVFQNNSDIIRPSATDVEIIGFDVYAVGDLDPLSLQEVLVDLKGAQDKVTSVKLYATGAKKGFSADNKVGEISVVPSEAQQTLTLSPSVSLNEKDNYFYLAYDMKSGLDSDISVDAALVNVKVGNAVILPASGDPEGNRLTKNMVNFDGKSTVQVNSSMMFYDDGGPDGKYTSATSGVMVFVPAEGKILRMIFNEFWTNYQDHLYVYDGVGTDGPVLADLSSSKATADLPTVIAKSESGALTVKFEPIKNNINNGWDALVEAFVPQPLSVSKVEVTPVNDVKMLRGSMNNKMLRAKVTLSGDKGVVDLTGFRFSALETEHEAVTSAKLWYTGTDPNFSTFDLYAEALPSEDMLFSGSRKYDEATEVYYWLSYDISTEAESGSKVQAHFGNLSYGDQVATDEAATDALLTVQDGIHGTFTIGTSGEYDFSTISEAVASLEPGIDGPVVFEIADGNYRELVTVPSVTGASGINTITMRSASGKRENVVITYDRYTDPGSSNYDKRYGIFTLDGVCHFTLENVTVSAGTYTGFPGIVFLRNASRYCTLRNSVVQSPPSTDAAKGTNLVYMYSKNEANCNSDFFTLEGCNLEGGYIGVYLQGTSYVALPKQMGGRVIGNRFCNQGSKAVYVSSEQDAVVRNNTIVSGTDLTTSYYAIDLNEFQGDIEVSGNSILMDAPKGSATGMYVRMYNPDKAVPGHRRIFNNEINMRNVSSAVTAIRVNNDLPGLEIANNTISILPSEDISPAATGVFFGGSTKEGCFANNIVQNQTSGVALQFNREDYIKDYGIPLYTNMLYTANADKLVYIGGSGDNVGNKNMDAWNTLGYDKGSFNELTTFLSPDVLEPADKGNLLNGTPLGFVAVDLYGAPRDTEHPTIGAYEYAESTVAPVMDDSYPVANNVGYDSASVAMKASLTSVGNYMVRPASEDAPSVEDIKASSLTFNLRKGVEDMVEITDLAPKNEYKFYAVLTSLRGMTSEHYFSTSFTTTYHPTVVADFEDAKVIDNRIEDGTFSFTGFRITGISDGVAPLPNTHAATMDDEYAVVQLTNADNLPLEGFYVKNSSEATLTSKDDKLAVVATKTIPAHKAWTYINLRDMKDMTYLEFETDGDLSIDNFGGEPQPLSVKIAHDESSRIDEGTSLSIPAEVKGGVEPFSYCWTDEADKLVGDEEVLTLTPSHSGTYFLSVEDAHGNKASARTVVLVTGSQYTATFDDLSLAPESFWYAYTDEPGYTSGSFYSGSFGFNNNYIAEWNSWNGFAYSDMTSTSFSSYIMDQFNSSVGHGVDDSKSYGVVFVSNWQGATEMTLSNTTAGEKVEGMWVTNSAWVTDAIVNGDGMEGAFGKGDWLKLKLIGLKADGGATDPVEFYLADYRADKVMNRWYLDTWQWVDLKPLGEIVKVRFDIDSSKKNNNGITTPTYVCIDNVGSGPAITETPIQILEVNQEEPVKEINLAGFFSFDDDEGTISYTLLSDTEYAAIENDNLIVEAPADTEFTLDLRATQRGRSEYIRMPVRMQLKGLGIHSVTLEGTAVYPNPASDHITVTAPASSFTVEIYSAEGIRVAADATVSGKLRMDVSALSCGAYIVRITDSDSGATAVAKLLIRN